MSKRKYDYRYTVKPPYWTGPRVLILATGEMYPVRSVVHDLIAGTKSYQVVIGEPPVYPLDVVPEAEPKDLRTGELVEDSDGNIIGVTYPYLAECKYYEAGEVEIVR